MATRRNIPSGVMVRTVGRLVHSPNQHWMISKLILKVAMQAWKASIDDMNPEFFEAATATLFAAGALDVSLQPQTMKRGRPGTCITVLAPPELRESLEAILLRETSTIGVRSWPAERRILPRRQIHVSTDFGNIQVKIVILPDGSERCTPEYADCHQAAAEHRVPEAREGGEVARGEGWE